MSPRYRVTLTKEERRELKALTKKGRIESRRFKHARALLLCDAGPEGPAWKIAVQMYRASDGMAFLLVTN